MSLRNDQTSLTTSSFTEFESKKRRRIESERRALNDKSRADSEVLNAVPHSGPLGIFKLVLGDAKPIEKRKVQNEGIN